MLFSSKCFVGRIVFRSEAPDGVDWRTACPVPAENVLDFDPPMFFCSPHFQSLETIMYGPLAAAGLLDRSVSGSLQDLLEGLKDAGGTPDLDQGQ